MARASLAAVAPSPDVVRSDLIDGGILFDLNSKRYFYLNVSGLAVWDHLEAGGDLASLEAALGARFPGVGGDDPYGLRGFVERLRDHQLVERRAPRPAHGSRPPALPERWNSPSVESHGSPLSEVVLSPFDPTVPIPE